MVCNHCGSQSHRTNHPKCPNYCTLCKEPGHRQKSNECKFRVCSKCGASGHSASECTQTKCSECGSTTHKSAKSFACPEHKCTNCKGTLEPKGHNRNDCPRMHGCSECGSTTHTSAKSFACPEHKCTNCKGTLEPKGHNRNDCPRMETEICDECGETGHSANKCPIRPCNACGLRDHKLQTSHLCPEHVCTLCNGEEEPKGHNNTICPRAECQTCKLFGHVAKDCAYANCLDVEDDWFNILFTKCESIVNAYFTEVSIPAISLRIDGIVRPISSWDQLQHKFTLSANQLMEIKLATYNFKRDENRKYDQIVRRLNKPNESPIHFAFTTDYDDDAVPKCPHCRTYLFPQEVSKAMWCCKKGQMLLCPR